jgi:hypothetical protein
MKLSELKKFVDSTLQNHGDMVVALATDVECNSMHHVDGAPWLEDHKFCLAPNTHGEEVLFAEIEEKGKEGKV